MFLVFSRKSQCSKLLLYSNRSDLPTGNIMFDHWKGKKNRPVDSSLLMAMRKQRLSATNLWLQIRTGFCQVKVTDQSLVNLQLKPMKWIQFCESDNDFKLNMLICFHSITFTHILVSLPNLVCRDAFSGSVGHFHKFLVVGIGTKMYLNMTFIPSAMTWLFICTFVNWINPYHESNHYREKWPCF